MNGYIYRLTELPICQDIVRFRHPDCQVMVVGEILGSSVPALRKESLQRNTTVPLEAS